MWLGYPNAIVLEWRQKSQGIPQVCFKTKKKVKGREEKRAQETLHTAKQER